METENNTPLDRLRAVEKILDEYEVKIGLSLFEENNSSEAEKYLSMTREQMEKLDIEGCAQAALVLGSFAFYIQRSYNRELSRVNWAESVLKNLISGREQQYKGSWDSQFAQAVKEDSYAEGVYKIKQYAKQRADRLTFLANSIKNVGDLFSNLQRAKVATR